MKFHLIFAALIFSLSAFADESIETFGKQMMNFYQRSSPEAFQQFQRDAVRLQSELTKDDSNGDVLVSVGIARIAEKHGWPIEAAGTIGSRANEILKGNSNFAKYVNDDTQVDPSKLDIWWISFFSTGDTNTSKKFFVMQASPSLMATYRRCLLLERLLGHSSRTAVKTRL